MQGARFSGMVSKMAAGGKLGRVHGAHQSLSQLRAPIANKTGGVFFQIT